jgi:hypothetical protein
MGHRQVVGAAGRATMTERDHRRPLARGGDLAMSAETVMEDVTGCCRGARVRAHAFPLTAQLVDEVAAELRLACRDCLF